MATSIVRKKSKLPAWRCLYSTTFGQRWLTVHAPNQAMAEMLAKNKLITHLYKCGWSFERVEPAVKEAPNGIAIST